ncbi:lysylphosphatidylglycerol synthase transmembrane domain-containing protein [Bacillus tianshenii]|nr:lysylphosphatidylglycerol synthase transmembrane domain-containing protein [Bacillus tianshenii]
MLSFLKRSVAFLLIGLFVYITMQFFSFERLVTYLQPFLDSPLLLLVVVLLYAGAFYLRAVAWHLYVARKLSVREAFYGVGLSLFFNHLLPFKAGEAVRVMTAVRRKALSWEESTHSVVVLRLLDLLFLGLIAGSGAVFLAVNVSIGLLGWILAVSVACFFIVSLPFVRKQLPRLEKHWRTLREGLTGKKGVAVLSLTFVSWVLEAVVLYLFANGLLGPLGAIWVNSMSVAGGVFQITPGGIGTYESVMSASLAVLHIPLSEGYHIAVVVHAFKFFFSFIVGAILLLIAPFHVSWQELKWKGGGKR